MSERLPTADGAAVRARRSPSCCARAAGCAAVAGLVLLAASAIGPARPAAARRDRRPRRRRRRPAARSRRSALALAGASRSARRSSPRSGFALVADVGQPMLADLREQVVDRALRLPLRAASSGPAPATSSRASATTSRSLGGGREALPTIAGAVLTVVLTFVGLAAIDVRFALAGLLCVPAPARRAALVPAARDAVSTRAERAAGGERAQALLDVVGGARTVRALDLGGSSCRASRARSQRERRASVRTIVRLRPASSTASTAPSSSGSRRCSPPASCWCARARPRVGDATAAALFFVRLFDPFNLAARRCRRRPAGARRRSRAWSASPSSRRRRRRRRRRRPRDARRRRRRAPRLRRRATRAARRRPPRRRRASGVAVVGVERAPARRRSPGRRRLPARRRRARFAGGVRSPSPARGDAPRRRRSSPRRCTSSPARSPTTCAWPRPDAADAELRGRARRASARWPGRGAARRPGDARRRGRPRPHRRAGAAARARPARSSPTRRSPCSTRRPPRPAAPARASLERAADRALAGRTALVVAHRLTQAAARRPRRRPRRAAGWSKTGTHAALVAAGGAYAALWHAWLASAPPRRLGRRRCLTGAALVVGGGQFGLLACTSWPRERRALTGSTVGGSERAVLCNGFDMGRFSRE